MASTASCLFSFRCLILLLGREKPAYRCLYIRLVEPDSLGCIFRALGPVMLVVASCIICLFTISYFDVLTPCLGLGPTSMLWWPLTAVGVWILVNLVLNYTLAVITPPVRITLRALLARCRS